MLLFLLHLLTLLPTNFGTHLRQIYLSPSQLPSLPSSARKNSLEHVLQAESESAMYSVSAASITSMSASFAPFVAKQRRWSKPSLYSSAAPALSPASQGELPSPAGSTLPRHHHHAHRVKTPVISPSPSATPGKCSVNDIFLTLTPMSEIGNRFTF
ncbi:uncharacterized protein LOC111378646 isoform X1 [Olea europaea var. sylvestris]|uniref:uncharacterized protein LOC111378646 isoform X1 n=1 Tax=Olea europaea var. sylvestris TaxID=158386 RepID=UPI000C1D8251|nr:uncharacterized protein LOC111378646 isoform X1 [Olea europaea var. sylvestris]